MESFAAIFHNEGFSISSTQDELRIRKMIMYELTSLVNQRKHWMLSKYSDKISIQQAFSELTVFTDLYKTYSLLAVCKRIIALEQTFNLILPSPTGNHSCRFDNFQAILSFSKIYLNVTAKRIHRQCKQ